jgi:hypothetical protein
MLKRPTWIFAGQIGQLVDREDAAVGPRQQPVVHRHLARELQARLGRLDRIDVAHHVRDRHIRGGELLDVSRLARQPGHRRVVTFGREPRAAGAADRGERIVVDFASRHDGDDLVEQRDERAEQTGLSLAAQAEQDEIMARQQRVYELWNHGVVVADDAGKEGAARAQLADQVLPDFLVHAATFHIAAFDRAPEFANGGDRRKILHSQILSTCDFGFLISDL